MSPDKDQERCESKVEDCVERRVMQCEKPKGHSGKHENREYEWWDAK